MAPVAVAPAGESMSREQDAKPLNETLNSFAKVFNLQPINFNTPTIVKEQVPGAMMMCPYKAPQPNEEIIGYELYYRRDCGGPFACNIAGLSAHDACFDTCCNPCAFGPIGCAMVFLGCASWLPFSLKKNQRMCQRPVYGKKGTDITKLIPHSSYRYIEGVNEHKA